MKISESDHNTVIKRSRSNKLRVMTFLSKPDAIYKFSKRMMKKSSSPKCLSNVHVLDISGATQNLKKQPTCGLQEKGGNSRAI
jgi:hypothetical protein